MKVIKKIVVFLIGMCSLSASFAGSPIDFAELSKQYAQVQAAPAVLAAQRNTILIFVSFSMPPESLKQWLKQANQIGAPLALRGFEDNSFKKTASDFQTLIGNVPQGIQIDPPSFEKYHITRVPAVVITDKETGAWDVVYGNVSLGAVLEGFIQQGSTPAIVDQAKQLQSLLQGSAV